MRATAALLTALLLVPLLASPAFGKPTRASGLKVAVGTGEVRVAEPINVCGTIFITPTIHKPSVFYVLARRDFAHQGLELRQDFSGRTVKAALLRPF